jgi:hypothetical protein
MAVINYRTPGSEAHSTPLLYFKVYPANAAVVFTSIVAAVLETHWMVHNNSYLTDVVII